MKKTILLSLLSSSLLLSQSTNAGEWAIGGLIGQSNFDQVCDDVSGCDDSDTSLGLNLSYNFNNAWGVELGYIDLGDFGGSNVTANGFNNLGSFDVSGDASAYYLAGTGTYTFSDSWSLTGRLGLADIDADLRVSNGNTSFSESESESGLFAGASLNYNFNQSLQAQLRYDNFDGDADSIALGLRYSFGK